jgi:uracil-DNA glycosylase family 4
MRALGQPYLPPLPSDKQLAEILDQFPFTDCVDEQAARWGITSNEMARRLLYEPTVIAVTDMRTGVSHNANFVPSSCLDGRTPRGPIVEYPVMIIGKAPNKDDTDFGRTMSGKVGSIFSTLLQEAGFEHEMLSSFYCVNTLRFPPPDGGKTIKSQWKKDSYPFLAQEIALTKPKCILCLGSEAVKAVFEQQTTLEKVRGKVFGLKNVRSLGTALPPIEVFDGDEDVIRVFATNHPSVLLSEAGAKHGIVSDLKQFKNIVLTGRPYTPVEERDYRYISTPEEMTSTVNEILEAGYRRISIDCEWGGRPKSGLLRYIQFSWKPMSACVMCLRGAGGVDLQSLQARSLMIDELRRLVTADGMGVIGHNLRADALWLEDLGVPVVKHMVFDTMLADHILNENAEHGLEMCTLRHTDMGRYDYPTAKWLKDNKVNEKQLSERGYLDVPDELLLPYSACDVDATFRISESMVKELISEGNEGPLRCFTDIVLPVTAAIHEIENTGILVDREKMIELVHIYEGKKRELLKEIREMHGDEQFNPRSVIQLREFLYGPVEKGNLNLVPYKTTEKPARMWEDIVRLPAQNRLGVSPSTDSETLEQLAVQSTNPIVSKLRDFKLIDQITKTFLRSAETVDEYGEEQYVDGLVGLIDPDGRIRTSISQMSETGRWKSSNPNLQNLPKKQDKELQRIMGESFETIRSCFIAGPGNVIIEADFKSAEIFTLGYLANCPDLIRDAAADLHARGAVNYFGCPKWDGFDSFLPPPDDWLQTYKAERVATKTINFGIPYQRGAKAVARQIKKETKGKIDCSQDQAQALINNYYSTYTEVDGYVKMSKNMVHNPGYIENPMGRRRRATTDTDRTKLAAQEREFVNFPIQSTVADMLNMAVMRLHRRDYEVSKPVKFKILLAVHDALLLEVPSEHIATMVDEVLPLCMKKLTVCPEWDIPGVWYSPCGFTLDIDVDVSTRWGTHASSEELRAAGVAERFVERYSAENRKKS